MRSSMLVAGFAVGLLTLPGSALACLPPRPPTVEQEAGAARATRESQADSWSEAVLVWEYEVGRVYSLTPMDQSAPPMLHVELKPVRVLKGHGRARRFEMLYPIACGSGPTLPTEAGTRVVAYSIDGSLDEMEDLSDLVAVAAVGDPGTLAALGLPPSR